MEGEAIFLQKSDLIDEKPADLVEVGEDEVRNNGVASEVNHRSKMFVIPTDIFSGDEGSGSLGKSMNSSQKAKLRLTIEMNIQQTNPAIVCDSLAPVADTANQQEEQPLTVMIDYPDNWKIAVNTCLQKLETEITQAPPKTVDECKEKQLKIKTEKFDINQNEVLNSTFVKAHPPLTSTLIHPAPEENVIEDTEKKESSRYFARSSSGEPSLYQTVMGDNGFGNLSDIVTMENEDLVSPHIKSSEDLSVDLKKVPTLNLSSRSSRLFQTEELSPGEKLIKLMHKLTRYRGVYGIYEDEDFIVQRLGRLNDFLGTIDDAAVQKACKENSYKEIKGLVSYFVLEKRFAIRSELLQTFSLLVQKSFIVAGYIFASEFPMVLAWEVMKGNFASKETYDYAYCFLQIISSSELTDLQLESIGLAFYSKVVDLLYDAEKHHYGQMTELVFDILLHYHAQLKDDGDFKWKSLCLSAAPRSLAALKKFKHRLMNHLMKTASAVLSSLDPDQSIVCEKKMKDVLVVLKDLIICKGTKGIFSNAELDIVLVTLTNALDENRSAEYNLEAFKTIHRILVTMKKEPSGLNKLICLVKELLDQQQTDESNFDRGNCYWGVLKKIYIILTS